jgi:hypothetical protein
MDGLQATGFGNPLIPFASIQEKVAVEQSPF